MTGLGHFRGLISDVTQKLLMKNTARVENLYRMIPIKMKKVRSSGPITWLGLTFIPVGSLLVLPKISKMQKSDANARFIILSLDPNLQKNG